MEEIGHKSTDFYYKVCFLVEPFHDVVINLEGMGIIREGTGLYLFDVGRKGRLHGGANFTEVFDEFWRVVAEETEHILVDENLAIAAGTTADANGRNRQFFRNQGG